MKKHPPQRMRAFTSLTGFTITELLVAMVITIVLAALVWNVTQSARRNAVVTSDLSNLRQIGVGAFQYMADHRMKLPPVMGRDANGATVYSQELIAKALGIEANLRDPNVPKESLGVMISPGDRALPPKRSALRSYAVNFYMGEIYTITNDPKIAEYYHQIISPAGVLYYLPGQHDRTDPNAQSRVVPASYPIAAGGDSTIGVRFEANGVTPALWADGHVAMVELTAIRANPGHYFFPKQTR